MNDTELARIAVDEGLLSAFELDRIRKQSVTSGEPLVVALLQAGLLRNSDIDRIRRDRMNSTTRIPGELVTTTHTRIVPDEVRAAALDPKAAFGRYTLIEKIGSGGMGSIWKAWDNTLGRWCALKLLHEEHAKHDDHRERFLREARAAARLAHPNIVQVYEVGVENDSVFIALEYVPGETLRQRIAHRATGPEMRRRIELVRQAAEGLGAAHQAGITHRDMKPENVLVLPTPKGGQSKVVDFGLAVDKTVVTRLTVAGDVFGTPAYMSPEQALGLQEILGPSTDVFATGCILYEIVTGKLPFDGDAAAASVYATIHTDPVPVRTHAPKVHRDLETIIMHCLEKDPGKRYPDAKELAEDLGRFMAGEPIVARPVGRLGILKRRASRNPALTAALCAAVLFGASLLGILWYERVATAENVLKDLDEGASLEEQAARIPGLLNIAAARYHSVLKEDPGNSRAVEGLARVAGAIRAKEEAERAAFAESAEVAAAADLAAARAAMADPRHFAAAGIFCDVLVDRHPEQAGSWATRARYRWLCDRPDAALADLDRARQIGPESRERRHLRALSLAALGRIAEARTAASIDPADPLASLEQAAILISQGRRDEAREALARVPARSALFHHLTGLLDARSAGWKGAVEDFEAALALDPAFLPSLLGLARGLRERSGPAAAVPRARDAVEMAPELLGPRVFLAMLLREAGDLPGAVRELDRAVALCDTPPLRSLRGHVRLQAGDPRGGEDLLAAQPR
ncbi:MAG: protein kinase [Planctomycetes bacterium]|nr:protein kinase [Planctomycetota bacterium]